MEILFQTLMSVLLWTLGSSTFSAPRTFLHLFSTFVTTPTTIPHIWSLLRRIHLLNELFPLYKHYPSYSAISLISYLSLSLLWNPNVLLLNIPTWTDLLAQGIGIFLRGELLWPSRWSLHCLSESPLSSPKLTIVFLSLKVGSGSPYSKLLRPFSAVPNSPNQNFFSLS